MKKIFLDLDDTFMDTETYYRELLKEKSLPVDINCAYAMGIKPKYREILENMLRNYSVIPLKENAENTLNLLSTEYEVIFCSSYTFEVEKESKKEFAKTFDKEIILCGGDNWDKHEVAMQGGILIDDSLEALRATNATVKIQMHNPYRARGMSFKEYLIGDSFVENLSQVIDILMKGVG